MNSVLKTNIGSLVPLTVLASSLFVVWHNIDKHLELTQHRIMVIEEMVKNHTDRLVELEKNEIRILDAVKRDIDRLIKIEEDNPIHKKN